MPTISETSPETRPTRQLHRLVDGVDRVDHVDGTSCGPEHQSIAERAAALRQDLVVFREAALRMANGVSGLIERLTPATETQATQPDVDEPDDLELENRTRVATRPFEPIYYRSMMKGPEPLTAEDLDEVDDLIASLRAVL